MRDIRKIMGTLIGILGFIAAMAGLTYAMYVDTETNSNVVSGGHDCEEIVSYTKGADIAITSANALKEVTNYTESSAQTELTFYATCGTSIGTIYINTGTNTSSHLLENMLRYTIIKNTSPTETYTGYITNTGDTAIEVGKLETTETTYTVHIWIEYNGESDPDSTFSGYIHASARQTSSFDE